MKTNVNVFIAFAGVTLIAVVAQGQADLVLHEKGAFEGYTLYAPLSSTTTYLVDIEGNTVHTWENDVRTCASVYLLDDGHLLRTVNTGQDMMGNGTFHGGGVGGGVQKLDWEGNVVWEFSHSSDKYCLHHDIEPMPNGNILMLSWEYKTKEEAIAAGRDPDTIDDQLWPDTIIEVKPNEEGGEIVWQWHVWDHLIQDLDPRRENYGVVEEHPERIDLNFGAETKPMGADQFQHLRSLGYLSGPAPARGGLLANSDWNHINSIDYNPKLDQIVLSARNFSELWIIDHSTTTQEAAGHTGGKQGKGGDLLYRWGNPQAYKMGDAEDQKLFVQHDVHWIEEGMPGAGDLLIFNNGEGRAEGKFSSVDQVSPPIDRKGGYDRPTNKPFGPQKAEWTYTAETRSEFYSGFISGAQRLPNGNTLICSGESALFFEVTDKGEIVWEYKYTNGFEGMPGFGGGPGGRGGFGMAPFGMGGPAGAGGRGGPGRRGGPGGVGGPGGMGMMGWPGMSGGMGVFRAIRLPADFPGLADKEMEVASKTEQ